MERLRSIAAVFSQSALEAGLEILDTNRLAVRSAMSALASPSLLQEAVGALDTHRSAIDKAMTAFASSSLLEGTLGALDSHRLAINNGMTAFASPSLMEGALGALGSRHLAIDDALAALSRSSMLEGALGAFDTHHLAIESALAAIARPRAIEKAFETFNSHHLILDNAISAMANVPTMTTMLESFANASSMIFRDSTALSDVFASIERVELSSFDLDNLGTDLASATHDFKSADNPVSLLYAYKNLPPLLKALFWFFLLHVFLPQVNSISASLLSPVVESYLQSSDLNDRGNIRKIKDMPASLDDLSTDGLRFITGNGVRLRSGPSKKSTVLDELVLGQVLVILSKNRNWIEVSYRYSDGHVMTGWVFTRYTARFVR